jgi:hypothetical protein
MTQENTGNEAIPQAERQEILLKLSKLLLDVDRLKLMGELAQHPCSANSLKRKLAVERVQLHLGKLEESGLVHKCIEQGEERYQLDHKQIFQLKKLLFARVEESQSQSAEEKDLAKFIKHDRIVQFPTHPAKLRQILAWLAEKFQPGVLYTEKQVNERLQGHATDHATLRRLLIDHSLLVRQSGIYQRPVDA